MKPQFAALQPRHMSIRLLMFEVYEEGQVFPLFVTSDPVDIEQHRQQYPLDKVVKRTWVREGGLDE